MTNSYLQTTLYILLILSSCNAQKKETYNPKAIELTNKAAEFIRTRQDDSVLAYLDKAIKIDSTYYIAYGSKAGVYLQRKNFKEGLRLLEMQLKFKPDFAETWSFAGMLKDHLGDTLAAQKYYEKSIEIFNERISDPHKQKFLKANKLNRAMSYILNGEEEKGHSELKKLKALYPDDLLLDDYLTLTKKGFLKRIFDEFAEQP